MILAQATTQPCPNLWTPNEVLTLLGFISTVFIGAVVTAIVKVIDAQKNAKVAVIQATAAGAKADANTTALAGLQTQVTQVALNTPPATHSAKRSPVVPATFADAQLRAAAEPDCPEVPPPATEG
jgi:hypothetical protein